VNISPSSRYISPEDPSVADANGWTPLHLCCDLGKASALRLLLAQAWTWDVDDMGWGVFLEIV